LEVELDENQLWEYYIKNIGCDFENLPWYVKRILFRQKIVAKFSKQ
jgi:hypothetical protein